VRCSRARVSGAGAPTAPDRRSRRRRVAGSGALAVAAVAAAAAVGAAAVDSVRTGSNPGAAGGEHSAAAHATRWACGA
jgi:hypothetical protein